MKRMAASFMSFAVLSFLFCNFIFIRSASANLISVSQEIAIGTDAAKYVEEKYKLVDDAALQARVNKIGQNIVAVSGRKDLKYTFKVLDSDDVNAFALPGGFIYVFRGLTDKMQTDDELAGILGHEVAHIVKRHSINQLQKNIGLTILATILLAKTENGLTAEPAILSAITAGYSRSDESQADRIGFDETLAAGYNPYSMLIGLMKLDSISPREKTDLFSDHPGILKRIENMKKYLDTLKIPVQVKETDSSAYIANASGQTPPLKVSAEGLSQLERTYFLAGNIYKISMQPAYNPDYYILDSDGSNIYIYYDDINIIKLTPDDAASAGIDLTTLAREYITSIKLLLSA
ncbi:M48 family metallopeptidase [Pectinatus haikarae]|uniref:Zn-dependent protease n=1 Tax=Pectinatus haikarae TaxID=349096 RepID=A0ABT9Y6W1_9FIRM|nr:M48 family metallopeptidase [Pectinatus haikarae]MDQ0203469.1 putative Zn-dependent protease [Pectinatus haikarae]